MSPFNLFGNLRTFTEEDVQFMLETKWELLWAVVRDSDSTKREILARQQEIFLEWEHERMRINEMIIDDRRRESIGPVHPSRRYPLRRAQNHPRSNTNHQARTTTSSGYEDIDEEMSDSGLVQAANDSTEAKSNSIQAPNIEQRASGGVNLPPNTPPIEVLPLDNARPRSASDGINLPPNAPPIEVLPLDNVRPQSAAGRVQPTFAARVMSFILNVWTVACLALIFAAATWIYYEYDNYCTVINASRHKLIKDCEYCRTDDGSVLRSERLLHMESDSNAAPPHKRGSFWLL